MDPMKIDFVNYFAVNKHCHCVTALVKVIFSLYIAVFLMSTQLLFDVAHSMQHFEL